MSDPLLAICPWCGIPVVEHLISGVEAPTDDRPGRRIYHCASAPPFGKPILVEPTR